MYYDIIIMQLKRSNKMRAFLIILGITGFLAACEKAPTETLVVPEPVLEKL
jgi:uncharacterized lipoprotein YajG